MAHLRVGTSRITPTPVTAAITIAMTAPPATPMSAIATGTWPSRHSGGATMVKAIDPANQPKAVHRTPTHRPWGFLRA